MYPVYPRCGPLVLVADAPLTTVLRTRCPFVCPFPYSSGPALGAMSFAELLMDDARHEGTIRVLDIPGEAL